MAKIAILVTTFLRPKLFEQALKSMHKYRPKEAIILVADQGLKPPIVFTPVNLNGVTYYQLPFNCGLSYARNFLVDRAKELGCEYCIIASDSMIFNERTKDICGLIKHMDKYDCIGCHLNGGVPIYWVGWLSLIPGKCFNLNFIDRRPDFGGGIENPTFFSCNIIHNFFIAKTDSLLAVKWDNNLKLAEHEDFFHRYSQAGYKVCWTPEISCDYIKTREGQQALFRDANWKDGLQKLYKKWNISHWISYENIHLGKQGVNNG